MICLRPPHRLAWLLALACTAGTAQEADDPLLTMIRERGLAPMQAAVAPLRDAAADLVIAAMNFLDVRYRLGGNSTTEGFDCSGFTRHVVRQTLGLELPRRADEQAHAADVVRIERAELKPGDLVFFNTLRRTFSHVGIYVGDGKFIHAPRQGAVVRVESMRQPYWERRFTGARRVAALGTNPRPTDSGE